MSETHSTSPEILPTDPVVVMNIELGKKLSKDTVLDVDYPALRQSLEAVGAPHDNSNLVFGVETQGKEKMTGFFISRSSAYRGNDGGPLAVVGYDPVIRPSHKAQSTIQHELQHYADSSAGRMTKKGRLYRAGQHPMAQRATLLGGATALGGMVTGLSAFSRPASDVLSHEAAMNILHASEVAGITGVVAALGGFALWSAYENDSDEVRAQAAGRLKLPQVLSLQKTSDTRR